MSLPVGYNTSKIYFADAIEFLTKYAWIYQHSNTAFIKSDVLENFRAEFQTYFSTITNKEFNEFPLLHTKTTNSVINNFQHKLTTLIPAKAFAEPTMRVSGFLSGSTELNKLKFHKMNTKKQHEITKLSQIVNQLCYADIDLLIDFGAGLGYLSEAIFKISNNKFLVLGLEAEAERVEAAKKRLRETLKKRCQKETSKIFFKQHFINLSSDKFIQENIHQLAEFNNIISPQFAIVGLHACADLTITAIKLFLTMASNARKLIIMPCCYHKIGLDSTTGIFQNFPLSQALKNVATRDLLCRPFLRLAAQQSPLVFTSMTEKEHKRHGIDMLRRSIATVIIDENSEYVTKLKFVKSQGEVESFQDFCQIYQLRCKPSNEILPWTKAHEEKFYSILQTLGAESYKFAEGLTCLQTALQKLCENIVLYDRVCYIEEYASKNNLKINVRCEKLFGLDEKLSPRCYVLIAEKL